MRSAEGGANGAAYQRRAVTRACSRGRLSAAYAGWTARSAGQAADGNTRARWRGAERPREHMSRRQFRGYARDKICRLQVNKCFNFKWIG